ncbi:MAG: DUF349 domain-containing protein, partial [Rhizobacter sp.]|nr:DUF349 domain-containing protein [Rhizobacter sp.]
MFRKTPPETTTSLVDAQVASEASLDATAATASQWQARLHAATGDDASLLDIARQAPTIELKCAAVAALGGETALKQAEREFRSHDRRVHRAAKQRLDRAIAQRLARQRAAELIESAAALAQEPTIPTNRLVELDRAWQAIDTALLESAQRSEFAALSVRLTELTRERGEQEAQQSRWLAAARKALPALQRVCESVAGGTDERAALAPALRDAEALLQGLPQGGSTDEAAGLGLALDSAIQASAHIGAHLDLLETLEQVADRPPNDNDAGLAGIAAAGPPEAVATTRPLSAGGAAERWNALPPVPDATLRSALQGRFDKWQQAQAARQRSRQADQRQRSIERSKANLQRQRATFDDLIRQAEDALANGNLAQTQQKMHAIDMSLKAGGASDAQHARVQALHAECTRLKGWQHWGGGRARDELVAEAEQIARATVAAMNDQAQAAKLPVTALAEAIARLRQRWKELDRLGGDGNQALWQRFDAALTSAYQPVAAQHAQLKARREENLQARLTLLAALEDKAPPARRGGDGEPEAPTMPIDWKEQARALDQFQQAWRKLGPIEHTVPHQARQALTERLHRAVECIDSPLRQARQAAQTEREDFIARARALASDRPGPELGSRLRELQAEWQQHAKGLPLARAAEAALWSEFKAATDAIFAQRRAVHKARDAELLDNLASRETMLAGLEALTQDTPTAQLKRVLADAETQWHKALEVPRAQVAVLDARYRAARGAALQHLTGKAQRGWQATCDALIAKLALCHEVERNAENDGATPSFPDLDVRWAAQPGLPQAWESVLTGRWARLKPSSSVDEKPAQRIETEL